jgi:glutaredoxin
LRLRLALALLALVACRRREEAPDAGPIDPVVTIAPDGADELLYVDLTGRVKKARGVAAVPELSRRAVAVEGPDGPGGAVWIADVSAPAAAGWPARRGNRRELERRGVAALPPGPGSRIDFPAVEPGPVAEVDGVVVYGTTWCGACGDARAWLDEHRVAYTFRSVEDDVAAAHDAARLCASLGVEPDRVPVIDVAGTVVIGFDPVRLTTILGESI